MVHGEMGRWRDGNARDGEVARGREGEMRGVSEEEDVGGSQEIGERGSLRQMTWPLDKAKNASEGFK